MNIKELIETIRQIDQKQVIIAIDGRTGAGKSTLGRQLADVLGGTLLHMDDFYLKKAQRTPSRLKEVGGNVDYERFLKEVLMPLKQGRMIIYRTFNHHKFAPHRFGIPIMAHQYVIIEGSYAHHPYFGHYYDVGIFCTITPTKQKERLIKREGIIKYQDFEKLWIPKEEAYFKEFEIEKGKIHYVCEDL